MRELIKYLPVLVLGAGVIAWGVRLEAVAGGNKENVNSLIVKSDRWGEERRKNREAQLIYSTRQEQIIKNLEQQQRVLELLEQRTRSLSAPSR